MDLQFWIDNNESLPHQIFMITMGGLYLLAYLLGTTYKVVNIIVYFLIIPSGYLYLLGKRTTNKLNFISLGMFTYFAFIPNKREFCNKLFDKSVDFLNYSAELFNSTYINMSVYICVYLLSFIFLILLIVNYKYYKILLTFCLMLIISYILFIYPNFPELMQYGLLKSSPN